MSERLASEQRSTPSTRSSPPRGSGLPVGVAVGPLGRRLVAQLIDVVVPAAIAGGTWAVATATLRTQTALVVTVVGAVLIAIWLLVLWWMYARRAAGPGMRAMRLQLVGLRNGRPIGWGRYFVRSLVLAVLAVSVVGLLLMVAFLIRHPRKQGWHDLAAESVVIKRRALAPRGNHGRSGQHGALSSAAPHAPAVETTASNEPLPAQPVSESGSGPVTSDRLSADDASATTVGAGSRPSRQGWVAMLDDKRSVEISGLILLGRNPQARAGEDYAELIKVADDSRTVSKTHLSLAVDDGGVFVMDRGSTNGTTVTSPNGASRACFAGDAVPVGAGSIVSFGDHWLRIERQA